MFVKKIRKITLAKNFEEDKKVDKEMLTLGGNLIGEDTKVVIIGNKNLCCVTIPIEQVTYRNLESVLKMVKPTFKKVVDLKSTLEPSNLNFNLEEVGMDHFCTYQNN
jgi:hypothetical protein